MGMVLGKSLNFKASDCAIIPPTDCEIPTNRTSTAPFQRAVYDQPNHFTVRLLEYQIHKYIPQVRELEMEGPYPRNHGKVERLHQMAFDFIATLPACFRFENPDTTFDEECPMLASQRDFLCATVWLFVLMLHRPYIFSVAKSRSEIMRAGIQMLHAQQRFFLILQPHQYKMFSLAYLSVEPCVSMLASLIAFPYENAEMAHEAFQRIKQTLQRLKKIRGTNKVAAQGADVIQNLLLRAEKNRPLSSPSAKLETPPSEDLSLGLFPIPGSHGANAFYSLTQQPPLFASDTSFEGMSDWNPQFEQPAPTAALSSPDYSLDAMTFRPVADLTYNDLAISASEEAMSASNGSDRMMNDIPPQFQGNFGEGSFWNFVNAGSGQWNGV